MSSLFRRLWSLPIPAVVALLLNPVSGTSDPLTSATSGGPVEAASAVSPPLGGLAQEVLDLAFGATSCAIRAGAVGDPATLTIIDYSRPSSERRLWVFDLSSRELLYEELVSHGQGSGGNYASSFSNAPGSHQSSLGLFVTAETYVGRNGYSLRLDGLDGGFNDRARERAIVMHGAPYVSEAFVEANGRLGRSWGCPAVRSGLERELLDRIKGGGLVFAYYPDPAWLGSSRYLGDCAAAAESSPS